VLVTYAVIPAKDFNGAKQRLAAFLQPHERRVLARAMLRDTLTACTQAAGLAGVGVVTCDRDVAAVADRTIYMRDGRIVGGPERAALDPVGAPAGPVRDS
jgi:2-phospho-L-lactate guanylyltransferase (CobY/MobA/RfbA family)